ncbi:MAG: hypothetical protein MUE70_15770 [Desulfobacterales bacterium]|nr:hypothetical protein [Desulfobacterales bacterium]
MKKFIFLGLAGEKEAFVDRLQEIGVMHIDLPAGASVPTEVIQELQKVTEARKFLARTAAKEPVASASGEMNYLAVCRAREELAQTEARLAAEISALKKERATLEPWGYFEPEGINLLRAKGLDVRFYRIPRRIFSNLALQDTPYFITRETEGEVAFVTFSEMPLQLPVIEEKLPAKSISAIDNEIKTRASQLKAISDEYKALSAHVMALGRAELQLTDEMEFKKALLNLEYELDDRLFLVTCWTMVEEAEIIRQIGDGFTYAHVCSDPAPGDRVPVLMQNRSPFDSGEDLVGIYSHPNYSDFDPSAWVLYSFVVFYGMIIGDAGYGLTLLAFTGLLHWRIKSKAPIWIRLRRLNYQLALAVTFFGLISASYFGIKISPDNPLNKLMLLDFSSMKGQNHVMLVSIIMGMVHISMALMIKFVRNRDLSALGWIVIIWSGFAAVYSNMQAGSVNPVAKWVLIAGVGTVILFSSNHRNPIIRILVGINASLGIVQLFSDVLSYLRLFALGLATMYMCQTFNLLGNMVYQSVPYIGFLPAALVLVTGHTINIVLGMMGGIIHGLRLNFLEWYRWCFEGDGLAFKPFRKIAANSNL